MLLMSMCHAMPFFSKLLSALAFPKLMASSMGALLQMLMCMFCRNMIITLLEYLQ